MNPNPAVKTAQSWREELAVAIVYGGLAWSLLVVVFFKDLSIATLAMFCGAPVFVCHSLIFGLAPMGRSSAKHRIPIMIIYLGSALVIYFRDFRGLRSTVVRVRCPDSQELLSPATGRAPDVIDPLCPSGPAGADSLSRGRR